MRVLLINLHYPFGKSQIYFNLSTAAVAVQVFALGHEAEILDLNLDELDEQLVGSVDVVGVSIFGAAYIPRAIETLALIRQMNPRARLIVGGQTVEKLDPDDFSRIFGTDVVQGGRAGLAEVLGCRAADIPAAEMLPFAPVWKKIGEERLAVYLAHEGTLFVSDGCRFNCAFCAARKNQPERFRDLIEFKADLRHFTEVAKRHGIGELKFYATSLDFFQSPKRIVEHLEVLARVQIETGVKIRVRCLSTMTWFLRAAREIPNFGALLQRAGLWCVGVGVDGSDESIWRAQDKRHNSAAQLVECLKLAREVDVDLELLMVFGFLEETPRTIVKTVWLSFTTLWHHHVIIRPYVAKPAVPGNQRWAEDRATVERLVANPRLFYNLDFCAVGSPFTHPKRWLRWMSNAAYLAICSLTLIGKSTTSPLLPQGETELYGRLATAVNRLMPFDR